MKKVFLIHPAKSTPNGGWKPWLMAELEKKDRYACSLPMPDPNNPVMEKWVNEVSRQLDNQQDEYYLVGHSLGGATILRCLESLSSEQVSSIKGVVLVSAPCQKTKTREIDNFFEKEFDYQKIKSYGKEIVVIHGDNDEIVPIKHANTIVSNLDAKLIIIQNGKHLTGSAGFTELPQCLDVLLEMINKN